eukprot:TRINITY_DN2138_c0_g1_i1.p2 TRINITY_DN2138_c0_g1~~TRINITY_DN2138_c0_g1_i1.p2  ORF type:complete len:264 (-),score=38.33 TRINITY_DN2138_c0_g1_i1:48-839(-)
MLSSISLLPLRSQTINPSYSTRNTHIRSSSKTTKQNYNRTSAADSKTRLSFMQIFRFYSAQQKPDNEIQREFINDQIKGEHTQDHRKSEIRKYSGQHNREIQVGSNREMIDARRGGTNDRDFTSGSLDLESVHDRTHEVGLRVVEEGKVYPNHAGFLFRVWSGIVGAVCNLVFCLGNIGFIPIGTIVFFALDIGLCRDGQDVGKRITGLIIVDHKTGKQASWRRVLVRYVVKWIVIAVTWVPWVFVGRPLHDIICGTSVRYIK